MAFDFIGNVDLKALGHILRPSYSEVEYLKI